MTESELQSYILKHYPLENEKIEWKEYKNLKHFVSGKCGDDIISYISAIANMEGGSLIIGIRDKTGEVIGIEDFYSYTCENIKLKILDQCINLSSEGFKVHSITTRDTRKTVWRFEIPKHKPRLPVYAHNKPWQRVGDSLVQIRPEREHAILSEPVGKIKDWSSAIIPGEVLDVLDKDAIAFARKQFGDKYPDYRERLLSWDDLTFLNKAGFLRNKQLTNTAVLLLGKEEYGSLIEPTAPLIFWDLKDGANRDLDYRVITIPFIFAADVMIGLIRNLRYRYLSDDTLFPTEIDQYDNYVIRECLHNCIAHQDYSLGRRITITETTDSILYTNAGNFIPGTIEEVIEADAPPDFYRNPFLTRAMVNMKMIDTQGGGIKRMFSIQKDRFFPLPEFELSANTVKVKVYGKILNKEYTQLLIEKAGIIDLKTVILLDYIQKGRSDLLSNKQVIFLKRDNYIEGRRPNIHISSKIALITGERIKYLNQKGVDDKHVKGLILEYIQTFRKAKKHEIDEYLFPKLSDLLSYHQKSIKIKNLLQSLKKDGVIYTKGKFWLLSNIE